MKKYSNREFFSSIIVTNNYKLFLCVDIIWLKNISNLRQYRIGISVIDTAGMTITA